MKIPILDFKPKNPSHIESLQQLAKDITAEMQIIHEQMTFLHETQLVIMRAVTEKRVVKNPERLIEMIHETMANNTFRLLFNELENKFLEQNSGGMKIESKRSWKHWLKDLFAGKDTSVQLKVEQKPNEMDGSQTTDK